MAALAQTKHVKLVACTDVVEASAQSLGEQFGVPYTTKLEELLARPDVDMVTIATPPSRISPSPSRPPGRGRRCCARSHRARAAGCGRHDRGVREGRGPAGHVLPSALPGRRGLGVELLAAGALGTVVAIRVHSLGEKKRSYWTGGFSGRTTTDWRKSKVASGGGVIITNLIHNIDLARFITGLEVGRAYAELGTFSTEVEVEDLGIATLRYQNDAIGLVEGIVMYVGRSGGLWT